MMMRTWVKLTSMVLLSGSPARLRATFAAGKMGSVEARALRAALRRQRARESGRLPPPYASHITHALYVNAGVFPQNEETFDQFGQVYLNAVKCCDALAAWDIAGETEIFRDHCQKATLIKLRSLEPYFSAMPWSQALKGKRVLVVSPFVDSLKKQFEKREALWDNEDILPPFELLTLRAPLSAALTQPESSDWFASLERIQDNDGHHRL